MQTDEDRLGAREYPSFSAQMLDSITPGGWALPFFSISFSAAWSSIDSASSFFSFRFSSSSDRSRLASETSMPP